MLLEQMGSPYAFGRTGTHHRPPADEADGALKGPTCPQLKSKHLSGQRESGLS